MDPDEMESIYMYIKQIEITNNCVGSLFLLHRQRCTTHHASTDGWLSVASQSTMLAQTVAMKLHSPHRRRQLFSAWHQHHKVKARARVQLLSLGQLKTLSSLVTLTSTMTSSQYYANMRHTAWICWPGQGVTTVGMAVASSNGFANPVKQVWVWHWPPQVIWSWHGPTLSFFVLSWLRASQQSNTTTCKCDIININICNTICGPSKTIFGQQHWSSGCFFEWIPFHLQCHCAV